MRSFEIHRYTRRAGQNAIGSGNHFSHFRSSMRSRKTLVAMKHSDKGVYPVVENGQGYGGFRSYG
jgi:hypothetical protein